MSLPTKNLHLLISNSFLIYKPYPIITDSDIQHCIWNQNPISPTWSRIGWIPSSLRYFLRYSKRVCECIPERISIEASRAQKSFSIKAFEICNNKKWEINPIEVFGFRWLISHISREGFRFLFHDRGICVRQIDKLIFLTDFEKGGHSNSSLYIFLIV